MWRGRYAACFRQSGEGGSEQKPAVQCVSVCVSVCLSMGVQVFCGDGGGRGVTEELIPYSRALTAHEKRLAALLQKRGRGAHLCE